MYTCTFIYEAYLFRGPGPGRARPGTGLLPSPPLPTPPSSPGPGRARPGPGPRKRYASYIDVHVHMYISIILYHPIPSHISLYYLVLSYISQTSLAPGATEWNGPDFGERSMSWNGTEHYFMERIIFGTARNGTERFIPDIYIYIYIYVHVYIYIYRHIER